MFFLSYSVMVSKALTFFFSCSASTDIIFRNPRQVVAFGGFP